MNRHIASAALLFTLATVPARGWATDFQINDHGMSSATFRSDALLETITGTSTMVQGTLTTDLANPDATTGTIQIPVTSLVTGVDLRDEHLHGADWLNSAEFPNIEFTIRSVDAPSGATLRHGEAVTATVTGDLTIHGVTRSVTTQAQVTFYEISDPGIASTYGISSNVIRVQAGFELELDDYGIQIPMPLQTKVSNTVALTIRVTATQS